MVKDYTMRGWDISVAILTTQAIELYALGALAVSLPALFVGDFIM